MYLEISHLGRSHTLKASRLESPLGGQEDSDEGAKYISVF